MGNITFAKYHKNKTNNSRGFHGLQSSVRECRQKMKDDYVVEVEFEMGLNSDQTFVGKDRTLPVWGSQLLNF